MTTEYVTVVRGIERYRGDSREEAIREWDRSTWNLAQVEGDRLTIQQWENDAMVRDGYIIHVGEGGSVYLHPTA